MKNVLLAAVAVLAIGGSLPAQAVVITPAVEYTNSSTLTDTRPFTLGYSFSLSAPVTINALGYWDNSLLNNDVGIWDSVGTLLTSTTILGTDPVIGHFRWGTIGELTLGAGTYTIGGEFFAGQDISWAFPNGASGLLTIPEYTWLADEQIQGFGLNFPTITTGGYGDNGILAVSFSVIDGVAEVPEPLTLALFGAGLAGLAAIRRRRRAKT